MHKGAIRGAEGFRALGQCSATGGIAQGWRVEGSTESRLLGREVSENRTLGLEDSPFWRDKGTGEW